MTDLTKITTPFGLLDAETQEALKAHGGPIEAFMANGTWEVAHATSWYASVTYRVKPKPPKPREVWLNEYPQGLSASCWATRDDADCAFAESRIRVVRFREVIE